MARKNRIRLYIDTALDNGFEIKLSDSQSHYLLHVMKLSAGDELLAFDNRSGEYLCSVKEAAKKSVTLNILDKTRGFFRPPDVWMLFAPVKKDQTDYIIQKATELGATALVPVITSRTIADKVRTDRFKAQAIEAAEQSRRIDIPEIFEAVSFDKLLSDWDGERKLFYLDETGAGDTIFKSFSEAARQNSGKTALLTGPEGGFSEAELTALRQAAFSRGVSMGERILRAETAVAAALACWQAIAGDWHKER